MSQENTKIAIEMIDVERSFGQQQVLKKVNLVVREGTTTVIVGPSGQGKSVILKHMLGLMKPDSGQVMVYGQDLSRMNKRQMKEVRKDFGVLFQNVALFDSMTVFDNVALPLRERTDASEAEIRNNVEEKLALMDLADMGGKFPAQLSGGMKKRVGLARALVMKPRIVFLMSRPPAWMSARVTRFTDCFTKHRKNLNIRLLLSVMMCLKYSNWPTTWLSSTMGGFLATCPPSSFSSRIIR